MAALSTEESYGNKFVHGTDLSYLPAAVTDLGHQGEGMVSTLDYLAGCKSGPDTGANRARDAVGSQFCLYPGTEFGLYILHSSKKVFDSHKVRLGSKLKH